MTIEEALRVLIDNGASLYANGRTTGGLNEVLAAAKVVSELGEGVSVSLYDCPLNWLERADTTRLLTDDDRTWLSGRCLDDLVCLHSVDLEGGS